MQEHRLPADFWYGRPLLDTLNKMLADKFGTAKLIRSFTNYQVNFDLDAIANKQLDFDAIKKIQHKLSSAAARHKCRCRL